MFGTKAVFEFPCSMYCADEFRHFISSQEKVMHLLPVEMLQMEQTKIRANQNQVTQCIYLATCHIGEM
jgi:hypothetical protein